MKMAAADVQQAPVLPSFGSVNDHRFEHQIETTKKTISGKPHDVKTTLNYYKDPEDGSPPHPTYVDRPETYNRPTESHPVTVHDVTGSEDKYSLDESGFQFHHHTSVEKDFVDNDQIRSSYYPETEQLLKDV